MVPTFYSVTLPAAAALFLERRLGANIPRRHTRLSTERNKAERRCGAERLLRECSSSVVEIEDSSTPSSRVPEITRIPNLWYGYANECLCHQADHTETKTNLGNHRVAQTTREGTPKPRDRKSTSLTRSASSQQTRVPKSIVRNESNHYPLLLHAAEGLLRHSKRISASQTQAIDCHKVPGFQAVYMRLSRPVRDPSLVMWPLESKVWRLSPVWTLPGLLVAQERSSIEHMRTRVCGSGDTKEEYATGEVQR
jgi:hypothetical protein